MRLCIILKHEINFLLLEIKYHDFSARKRYKISICPSNMSRTHVTKVFDYARVRYSPRVMKFSAGVEQKVGFWLVCVELRHPHHQIQVTAIRIKRNM